MNSWRFYFHHSLIGYFYKRIREKYFPAAVPKQIKYKNVILSLESLHPSMQSVILAGNYEACESHLLPMLISPSDTILEIGGAIGFISLFCVKNLGITNIITVEPNPKTAAQLEANFTINGVTPHLIEGALAPTDGPMQFKTSDMFWSDSLCSSETSESDNYITVQGITFQSLVKQAGIEFNVLIMDVEGAEKFLPLSDIPKHVDKILIEIHPRMIGVREAYNVLESLIHLGFHINGHAGDVWALKR